MVQIVPAILATTKEQYQENLERITSSESLSDSWIHIDFADNKFVQNQTISVEEVNQYPINNKKEAHLMVTNPLNWLKKIKEAGFDRVIIHIESQDDIDECLEKANSLGLKIGLALNPETSIEKIKPFLDKIDLVLIMSVNPGFQGQEFIPESLEKIKRATDIIETRPLAIGVDGHINDQTVKGIIEVGATHLVVGSYLLEGNTDENLEKIWQIIKT